MLGAALWRFAAPIATEVGCDFARGPCTVPWGDSTLEIATDPRPPRAGVETRFTVRLARGVAALPDAATIEFEMPGMEMGDHRAALTRGTDGASLRGTASLPICPLGGTLWRATLHFEDAPAAELTFQIAP